MANYLLMVGLECGIMVEVALKLLGWSLTAGRGFVGFVVPIPILPLSKILNLSICAVLNDK